MIVFKGTPVLFLNTLAYRTSAQTYPGGNKISINEIIIIIKKKKSVPKIQEVGIQMKHLMFV